MWNDPLDPNSSDLLVRTKAIDELSAYLSSPTKRGGAYLLCGGYGQGKTSALNLLGELSEKRPIEVYYRDLSQHKTLEALTSMLRDDLWPLVQSNLGKQSVPLVGLDQLHNVDTDLAEKFFKDNQAEFEKWKLAGAFVVVAGDERFAKATRSGGPLGAIFDDELSIPKFAPEMAAQMLRLRMDAAASEKPLHFPFTDDAIEAIVTRWPSFSEAAVAKGVSSGLEAALRRWSRMTIFSRSAVG